MINYKGVIRVLFCLFLSLIAVFTYSEGRFYAFLIELMDKNMLELVYSTSFDFESGKVNVVYFPIDKEWYVFENDGGVVVNLFSFHWDNKESRIVLGDVEGGVASINRARQIVDQAYTCEYKLIEGSKLRDLIVNK